MRMYSMSNRVPSHNRHLSSTVHAACEAVTNGHGCSSATDDAVLVWNTFKSSRSAMEFEHLWPTSQQTFRPP